MSLAVPSRFDRCPTTAFLVLLALAAFVALGVCLPAEGPAAAESDSGGCEPRLPLEVAWIAGDSGASSSDTTLTLVMTAQTELPSVRLELLLPENVSLLSGPPEFQGRLGPGEEKRLGLRISRSGAAKLQARVTAVTPGGLVFRRGASLDLTAGGQARNRCAPGRLVCSPGGGRQVREFPSETDRRGRR